MSAPTWFYLILPHRSIGTVWFLAKDIEKSKEPSNPVQSLGSQLWYPPVSRCSY